MVFVQLAVNPVNYDLTFQICLIRDVMKSAGTNLLCSHNLYLIVQA